MKTQKKLVNQESRKVLLSELEIANSVWSRFCGLMFRAKPAKRFGILIIPCKSIHTMWMRFSIDVFFIDKKGLVVGSRTNVKPWRVLIAPRKTHSVLETAVGSLIIREGDIIQVAE